MHPPEEELPSLHAQGDGRAFEALVRRHGGAMLRLAYRLTGDLEAARDVRQSALVSAHHALAAFDGRARLSTWLHRLVVNASRDEGRRARARGDAQARAVRDTGSRGNGRAEDRASPARLAEAAEASRRVARAVAALPEREREVVVLRHYGELPFTEVAAVVGAPVTTVKSRMARGMARLRTLLKDLQPHG